MLNINKDDLLVREQNSLEKLASSFGFDVVIEKDDSGYFICESINGLLMVDANFFLGNTEEEARDYLNAVMGDDCEVHHGD